MNEAGDYGENLTLPQSKIILLKNYCYHKYFELKLDSEVNRFLTSVIPCKHCEKTFSGHPLHFYLNFNPLHNPLHNPYFFSKVSVGK